MKHVAYSFAHYTPNLVSGGAIAYVPETGERLYDAWLDIEEQFDGVTPKIDLGLFLAGRQGLADALGVSLLCTANRIDNVIPDSDPGTTGFDMPHSGTNLQQGGAGFPQFMTADPFCVCVSQDGTPSGADPGSTTGRAVLHLLILPAD